MVIRQPTATSKDFGPIPLAEITGGMEKLILENGSSG